MGILKRLLFLLVSFIALTSLVSGLLMMIKPNGELLNLPLSLLKESSLKNFLFPGILLFTVVGGTNGLAAYHHLKQSSHRYNWAIAGGVIIIGWIIGQMMIIQAVSWLHIFYLSIGVCIILLAFQLKGKWAV